MNEFYLFLVCFIRAYSGVYVYVVSKCFTTFWLLLLLDNIADVFCSIILVSRNFLDICKCTYMRQKEEKREL